MLIIFIVLEKNDFVHFVHVELFDIAFLGDLLRSTFVRRPSTIYIFDFLL